MFLFAGFILGLAGSLHCLGMCGPIVLALNHGSWPSRLAYHLGRSASYALLGGVLGLLGAGAVALGHQQALSIAAGVLMIVLAGLALAGNHLRPLPVLAPVSGWVGRTLGKLLGKRQTLGQSLGLGFVNGLLPCGLVYVAMAGALGTGSAGWGMGYMAAFGFGTVPALLALALAGSRLRWPRLRSLTQVAALAVGALMVVRGLGLGIPYFSPKAEPQAAFASHSPHQPSALHQPSAAPAPAVGGFSCCRRPAPDTLISTIAETQAP